VFIKNLDKNFTKLEVILSYYKFRLICGVQHILCCVFVLFVFGLCTVPYVTVSLYCPFLIFDTQTIPMSDQSQKPIEKS
jgi:hypothetical protein